MGEPGTKEPLTPRGARGLRRRPHRPQAHPLDPRREQAGRAHAHRRPVRAPRLQHRHARRRPTDDPTLSDITLTSTARSTRVVQALARPELREQCAGLRGGCGGTLLGGGAPGRGAARDDARHDDRCVRLRLDVRDLGGGGLRGCRRRDVDRLGLDGRGGRLDMVSTPASASTAAIGARASLPWSSAATSASASASTGSAMTSVSVSRGRTRPSICHGSASATARSPRRPRPRRWHLRHPATRPRGSR